MPLHSVFRETLAFIGSYKLLESLTCLKAVVDFSIHSSVLIQGSDLHNLCAYWGCIQNFRLIMEAGELGRVAVAVLYVDDNSGKVSLDRDFLVSHLSGRTGGRVNVSLREKKAFIAM